MAKKILIIGGGVSGCITAYQLAKLGHRVTLMQMGWKLGGKGSSGRDFQSGDQCSIEHGPHIWFGSYTNTWKIYEEIYDKYLSINNGRHGEFTSLRDKSKIPIFHATNAGVIVGKSGINSDDWEYRYAEAGNEDSPIKRLIDHVSANITLEDIIEYIKAINGVDPDPSASIIRGWLDKYLFAKLGSLIRDQLYKPALQIIKLIRSANLSFHNTLLPGRLKNVAKANDLFLTIACIYLEYIKLQKLSYDELDRHEFSDLLKLNGCNFYSIETNDLLRAFYDTFFSYVTDSNGNLKENLSAGSAIKGILWANFSYGQHAPDGEKHHFSYMMKAGMGEIAFTPLYEVLKDKNNSGFEHDVNFQFFKKLTSVEVDSETKSIKSVTILNQAEEIHGQETYQPIEENITGMSCWRSHPDFDQLTPDSQLPDDDLGFESEWTLGCRAQSSHTYSIGNESENSFDHLVLATPIESIKFFGQELFDNDSVINEAKQLKSIITIASQLWITSETDVPLWDGKYDSPFVAGAIAGFWDIWLDYSSVIKSENLNDESIKHLLYGCGVWPGITSAIDLENANYPHVVKADVEHNLDNWLQTEAPHIWKELSKDDGSFDSQRVKQRYVRVNLDPSERYVTSPAGYQEYRFTNKEVTIKKLSFAGDWMRTGINLGCVEAAVISGLEAAQHASGQATDIIYPDED